MDTEDCLTYVLSPFGERHAMGKANFDRVWFNFRSHIRG